MIIQLVSTVDYLAYCLVLIDSLKLNGFDAKFSILITDIKFDLKEYIPDKLDRKIEILTCEDLSTYKELLIMRNYYNKLEFNCACKIHAIYHQLFFNNNDSCLFLDADMICLADFSDKLVIKKDILLIPHTIAPFPEDGQYPNNLQIFLYGHINGGFIFIKKSDDTLKCLKWLLKNTKYKWFLALDYGMNCDQQWLSSLIYFYNYITEITFDDTINIAYWNLHERKLLLKDSIYYVNNKKAALVHFSGFQYNLKDPIFTIWHHRKFDYNTEAAINVLIREYTEKVFLAKKELLNISGNISYCKKSLPERMKIAEDIWNIKYTKFVENTYNINELIRGILGKMLKKLNCLNKKV
jgi:hypothetical protein